MTHVGRHQATFRYHSVNGSILLALEDDILRDEFLIQSRLSRLKIIMAVQQLRRISDSTSSILAPRFIKLIKYNQFKKVRHLGEGI